MNIGNRQGRNIGRGVALAALAVVASVSCAGRRTLSPLTAQERFREAISRFGNGDYDQARLQFEAVIFEHPGSVIADSAHYFVGLSYFHQQEYDVAGGEFQRFATQYPTSALVDDAELMRARCSFFGAPKNTGLDQHYTETCVNLAQTFKDDHPASELLPAADSLLAACWERLSRKDFNAGRLYYRVGADPAARVYFQLVLDRFPQSPLVPHTLYLMGETYRRRGMHDSALVWYEKLIYLYPENGITGKAKKRTAKLRHLPPPSPAATQGETP